MLKLQNTRYMQYVSAYTSTFSITASAMFLCWSSPSIPKLIAEDSPMGRPITDEEGSWIVSCCIFASVFSIFLVPWTIEKYGRKKTLLAAAIPTFLAWIMVIFANSVSILIVARCIGGLALGLNCICCPMYNGEIADNDIRGKLGTTFCFMKLLSVFIVLSIGPFVSYKALAGICAAFPVLFFVMFLPMPESPYFFIKVGRREEAVASLTKLSGKNALPESIQKRIVEIEASIRDNAKMKSSLWEYLTNREYRMSIIVMLGIGTLQQFSGVIAIDSYMQTIIGSSKSNISPEVSSIVYGAIQFPAVILAAILVDKVGRKPILTISAWMCACALAAEGVYFYLQNVVQQDVSFISWLPTTGIVVFSMGANFGLYNLPYVLLGELFASNIKEIAVGFWSTYGGLLAFFASKFFKPMANLWGIHVVFWFFACVCILGSIHVLVLVPETKGKSFAEIQAKLNKRVNRNCDTGKIITIN